jgi:phosphatidylglycerophosphatase A
MSAALRPTAAFAFSHPAHAIAFGFGAGLVPRGPGTAGTLAAWALGWLLLQHYPALAVLALAAPLFLVGLWACGVTGRHLGVPDHGAMVWDEIVAFLIVLAIVPRELAWQAGAFVLFRAFDIAKPPPIRAFERRWHGGFGVMFDDLLAAAYTLLVLAAFKRVLL